MNVLAFAFVIAVELMPTVAPVPLSLTVTAAAASLVAVGLAGRAVEASEMTARDVFSASATNRVAASSERDACH
jgi:hypothetical protein